MNHWHDVYVINKEHMKDIRSEVCRERLARELRGRRSHPGRAFIELLMAVLASFGLAGK